jgi:uncharacterized radical SAM superfamily protein
MDSNSPSTNYTQHVKYLTEIGGKLWNCHVEIRDEEKEEKIKEIINECWVVCIDVVREQMSIIIRISSLIDSACYVVDSFPYWEKRFDLLTSVARFP